MTRDPNSSRESPRVGHTCTHCGLPAPAPQHEGEPTFCCHGCAAVYELLQEEELGGFYELRARSGEARPLKAVDERSLKAASALYEHLDEPFSSFSPQEPQEPQGKGEDESERERKAQLCETTLYLEGMHCAACVWVLEKTPERMPGVKEAQANFGERSVRLVWDQAHIKLSEVARELHRLGYQSHSLTDDHERAEREARRASLMRLGVTFAIMGNVMLMAIAEYVGGVEPEFVSTFRGLSLALATPQVTYGALPFWRGAYQGLKARTPHMDMPIVVGLSVSYVASAWATLTGRGEVYFDSVTALVFLLLLGRYAQERGQSWATNAASLWQRYAPRVAWRLVEPSEGASNQAERSLKAGEERDEQGRVWRATPIKRVEVGDIVRVTSGEVCPIDGRVLSGEGHFDEAALTGESRWVSRGEGARVAQGARCVALMGAPLEVEVQAVGRATRMGRLIEEISAARNAKALSVQRADHLAAWLVIAVFTLSLVAGLYWGLWVGSWTRAFDVVVSLCVITCPCALGLATPLALAVGRAKALKAGVLLRGSDVIERVADLEHLTLDKTGTLTSGQLSVTRFKLLEREVGEALGEALWWVVEGLEREARHPSGTALMSYARARPSSLNPQNSHQEQVEGWRERVGVGVEGYFTINGARALWRLSRVEMSGLSQQAQAYIDEILASGESPVGLWRDEQLIALFGLSDPPRPKVKGALERLKALGLSLSVRSGDHPQLTLALAERLGLSNAQGRCSPEEKAEEQRLMSTKGCAVAMVGDGVNDALAFTQSSVGVAVSGGAAVVIEAAHVYLQRGVISLPVLIEGSRRVMGLARLNVRFALVYNVIFATLAIMGEVTPLVAAVLMPISSVSVTLLSALWPTYQVEDEG